MTHKQLKQNGIKRKPPVQVSYNRINDDYSRKPLLYGSGNVEHLAVESSKARLMLNSAKKSRRASREFSSYFQAPRKNSDAVYVITSHTAPFPITKSKVNKNPSFVQNLNDSNNYIFPINYITDNEENESFHKICNCYECKRQNCQVQGAWNEKWDFKDNIMRFADNCTMTLSLNDASCSVCNSIAQTSNTSEATTSSSDVAVRDPPNTPLQQYSPNPILKKPEHDSNFGQTFNPSNSRHVTVVQDCPTCDRKLTDYEVLLQSFQAEVKPNPPCPNNSTEYNDYESQRKTLYNEGISDTNAINVQTSANLPYCILYPKRSESPDNLNRHFNHVSNKSKCISGNSGIPYAHNAHSKYHYDCKIPKVEPCWEIEDEMTRAVASRALTRQPHVKRDGRWDRVPIKLPRRVLTSERDIESFIDSRGSTLSRPICSLVEIK